MCGCVEISLSLFLPLIFLQQIKHELLESQQKVSSLQELSAQLLLTTKAGAQLLHTQRSEPFGAQGSECVEAQEKVHVIMNRLKLLLREVTSDLQGLERRLEAVNTQQVRERKHIHNPAFVDLLFKIILFYSAGVFVADRPIRNLSLPWPDVRGDWTKSHTIGNVFPHLHL